jgi:diguanylate cyclase (GGDEF)-like protein
MVVFIVSTVLVKEPHNWIYDIENVLIAGSVSLLFSWQITMQRLVSALKESRLEEENTVDELTRLKNRRDFMQTFQRRVSNYRSYDDWLCIAIMDIDYFKDYNDHYGHPQGDECLRAIGGVLNSLEELGIYAARVGGEEFALIWHEKDSGSIKKTIFKIQHIIHELQIPHEKSQVAAHITVSMGIHTVRSGESDNIHILYDMADKALYTAKRSGRNRAVVHGEEITLFKAEKKIA